MAKKNIEVKEEKVQNDIEAVAVEKNKKGLRVKKKSSREKGRPNGGRKSAEMGMCVQKKKREQRSVLACTLEIGQGNEKNTHQTKKRKFPAGCDKKRAAAHPQY